MSRSSRLDISLGGPSTRRRYAERRSAARQAVPWSTWLIAGCGLWVAALVVFAVSTRLTERPTPPAARPFAVIPAPVIQDAPRGFEVLEPAHGQAHQPRLARPLLAALPPFVLPGTAPGFGKELLEAPQAVVRDEPAAADCQQLGTRVQFIQNPAEAFRLAGEQKKMVFMIHLSGNFEDRGFT